MKAKVEELRLSRGQDWLHEWRGIVQSKELMDRANSVETRTGTTPAKEEARSSPPNEGLTEDAFARTTLSVDGTFGNIVEGF